METRQEYQPIGACNRRKISLPIKCSLAQSKRQKPSQRFLDSTTPVYVTKPKKKNYALRKNVRFCAIRQRSNGQIASDKLGQFGLLIFVLFIIRSWGVRSSIDTLIILMPRHDLIRKLLSEERQVVLIRKT
jgi:hypothetical protein